MYCDNDDCPRPREPVDDGHAFSGYGYRVKFHPECCPRELDGTTCAGDHHTGPRPHFIPVDAEVYGLVVRHREQILERLRRCGDEPEWVTLAAAVRSLLDLPPRNGDDG